MEHMAKRMCLEDKPSILMEGFSDSSMFDGIPKEYFDYIYSIENDSAEAIRGCIQKVLEEDVAVPEEKGQKSKAYALNEKNYKVQGERIVEFLKKVLK